MRLCLLFRIHQRSMCLLTTTSSRNNKPLPRKHLTPLTRHIRCYTATHDWTRLFILDAIRQPRRIPRICQGVLLERSSNSETTIQLLWAMTFILTVGTELALPAYGRDPLDTSTIANLPKILHVRANGYDSASAFVTRNTVCTFCHLEVPFIVKQGLVRST
ncbi:hypothetical protein CUC08_Gglean012708 [Alternaria sp. MG1]|nr:hypothetical protein CUC08_Gglean012708 [Alternaria sp. MG1]